MDELYGSIHVNRDLETVLEKRLGSRDGLVEEIINQVNIYIKGKFERFKVFDLRKF